MRHWRRSTAEAGLSLQRRTTNEMDFTKYMAFQTHRLTAQASMSIETEVRFRTTIPDRARRGTDWDRIG